MNLNNQAEKKKQPNVFLWVLIPFLFTLLVGGLFFGFIFYANYLQAKTEAEFKNNYQPIKITIDLIINDINRIASGQLTNKEFKTLAASVKEKLDQCETATKPLYFPERFIDLRSNTLLWITSAREYLNAHDEMTSWLEQCEMTAHNLQLQQIITEFQVSIYINNPYSTDWDYYQALSANKKYADAIEKLSKDAENFQTSCEKTREKHKILLSQTTILNFSLGSHDMEIVNPLNELFLDKLDKQKPI